MRRLPPERCFYGNFVELCARETLRKAGAHYVIDEFVELPAVIDDINERLARGDKP